MPTDEDEIRRASERRRGYIENGGLVPIPDPTVLTTAQLDRAISNLDSRITARLDAADKAAQLLHDDFVRVPTEMDRRLSAMMELVDTKLDKVAAISNERLSRIDLQFSEREKRDTQTQVAQQLAVKDAFAAQKELVNDQTKSAATAIAKSEASVNDRLTQLQLLSEATKAGFEQRLNDVKERITEITAQKKGGVDAFGVMIALGTIFISLGILATAIVIHWSH